MAINKIKFDDLLLRSLGLQGKKNETYPYTRLLWEAMRKDRTFLKARRKCLAAIKKCKQKSKRGKLITEFEENWLVSPYIGPENSLSHFSFRGLGSAVAIREIHRDSGLPTRLILAINLRIPRYIVENHLRGIVDFFYKQRSSKLPKSSQKRLRLAEYLRYCNALILRKEQKMSFPEIASIIFPHVKNGSAARMARRDYKNALSLLKNIKAEIQRGQISLSTN